MDGNRAEVNMRGGGLAEDGGCFAESEEVGVGEAGEGDPGGGLAWFVCRWIRVGEVRRGCKWACMVRDGERDEGDHADQRLSSASEP